ncbi:hypothetical protein, partial [Candidatus Thiosymbion oneisti]|uniref:hypothetical protein n=1 Tax=Candidatus Thiosymbion oneisti TaxID=589554 RepID=UPI001C4026FC
MTAKDIISRDLLKRLTTDFVHHLLGLDAQTIGGVLTLLFPSCIRFHLNVLFWLGRANLPFQALVPTSQADRMSALQGCESGWDRRLSDGFRNRSYGFRRCCTRI